MSRFAMTILSVLALAALPAWALAAEPDADAMAKMMELMKPGKEHAALAKHVGSWDCAVSAYMAPGAPPEVSKGTAVVTSIFDGRFFKQDYSGSMMGQPFTGVGIDGFDRASGKYVSTWMDSMSTGLMHETGTSTDDGKTIEYTGEVGDCMAPGKMVKIRSVYTNTSDDAFGFVMYQTRDGKESKAIEIQYTRQKGKK